MKQLFITILSVLVAVLASCSKPDPLPPADDQQPEVEQPEDQIPEVPSDGLVDKIITVSNLQSKTFVDGSFTDDGKVMMKWFADDSISVWDGVANRKFVMVSEPVGTYAVFKGRVSPEATDFYAFYPYKSDLQISQGTGCRFTAPLLQSQYANPEGGVVSDAVYAAGKVDAQDRLSFSIKPSFLIFSFDEDESVTSVSIEGNSDDDYLYGSWQLDCSPEGTVTSSFADDSMRGKKVTFANEDGTPFRTGVTYYMVLPEVNFEAGYTVTILNSDGTETVMLALWTLWTSCTVVSVCAILTINTICLNLITICISEPLAVKGPVVIAVCVLLNANNWCVTILAVCTIGAVLTILTVVDGHWI